MFSTFTREIFTSDMVRIRVVTALLGLLLHKNLCTTFHYFTSIIIAMSANAQAESVIKNIIKEICLECSSHGIVVSETLAAFMVSIA